MDEQQGRRERQPNEGERQSAHVTGTPPQTGITHGAGTCSDTGDPTGTPSSGSTTGATGTAGADLRPGGADDAIAVPEPEEQPARKITPDEAPTAATRRDTGQAG
jgi:hypothetical protein